MGAKKDLNINPRKFLLTPEETSKLKNSDIGKKPSDFRKKPSDFGKKPMKELEETQSPVTPVIPLRTFLLDRPKSYCFKNPFLSQDDDDGIKRNSTPFPGSFQPVVKSCTSRLNKDFVKFDEPLGDGSFGYCYKVLHRVDGCYYALKISKQGYDLLHDTRTDVSRAQTEIQSMAYLGSHKNLVAYYGAWYENKRLHIQLEYCEGSLQSKSLVGALTSELDFQSVLYQVAKGLEHIHGRGVVHLDIKPANILVKDGVYKIGDFGLAAFSDERVSLYTKAGDWHYMPKNCEEGDSTKIDIFALGISVYEIMMRHHLGEPRQQKIEMPRSVDVQLDLNLPGYSRKFLELLQAMVDNDPDIRPSAKDIVKNPMLNAARLFYEMH